MTVTCWSYGDHNADYETRWRLFLILKEKKMYKHIYTTIEGRVARAVIELHFPDKKLYIGTLLILKDDHFMIFIVTNWMLCGRCPFMGNSYIPK